MTMALARTIEGGRRRLATALLQVHLRMVRSRYGESPIPVAYWLWWQRVLRAISGLSNPLSPPPDAIVKREDRLGIEELSQLGAEDFVGGWALDPATIRLLWRQLWLDRPRVIVEWGSGVSTVVFAVYAALSRSRHGRQCVVLAMEQDVRFKAETERRLEKENLSEFATLFHAPVREGPYDLVRLGAAPPERAVDWILIDGPSGPPGCRSWTLPALRGHCGSGARWFLDDGFRDGELAILQQWSNVPGVVVHGIYPIGKGLATGRAR
jgi:hypothetical protein